MGKRNKGVWATGFVAGIIGYFAVALVFAIINLVMGRSPFYTAALLGSSLFYGLTDPAALEIAVGPVAAFNAAHLVAFLSAGLITSWLFVLGERIPVVQYVAFAGLVLVGLNIYVGVAVVAWRVMGDAAWWQVGFAGSVAAIAMLVYLLRAHPVLAREMRDLPWEQPPEEVVREVRKAVSSAPTHVLSPEDVQVLAGTPATISTTDIERLLRSHHELQSEVDRLRDALVAADHWLDDGGRP